MPLEHIINVPIMVITIINNAVRNSFEYKIKKELF